PRNGARVVARAWVDAAYKKRLLDPATATKAIADLGYRGGQGEYMVVVENTPAVHNLVVCTLCSCYPWPALGLPPTWYKMPAYRSRAASEPRKLLSEIGREAAESRELRVADSSGGTGATALPRRPAGAAGSPPGGRRARGGGGRTPSPPSPPAPR